MTDPTPIIKFYGHCGKCTDCGGIVKMFRIGAGLTLDPDRVHCLACGKDYQVDFEGQTIQQWEAQQWAQKSEPLQ